MARKAMLTLEETARLAAAYVRVEERLFETLGGWAEEVPDLEVKAHLAASSRHHAWHAQLWRGMRPTHLDDPPPDRATVALADAVADHAGPGTLERLAGLYRVVVPRLVVAYRRHAAAASGVGDGPTARVLALVLSDEVEEWARGEDLVQTLVHGPDEVERAAARQARLEQALLRARNVDGAAGLT